jgi:putative hydrolase of the HAD superfamily
MPNMKTDYPPKFEYILFDLDETLYPKEAGLMRAVGERILLFMVQKVGIPLDDARLKQHEYFQRYGTTLRGLMVEHHINPHEFLDFVHDVELRGFLLPCPPLDALLHELPWRKVIFTNADRWHAERVLEVLQVRPHFEAIIDIQALDYRCKPDPWTYHRALELLGGVSGKACIIVDDIPRNLFPAKDLGMTTILVGEQSRSIGIDYVTPTILHAKQLFKNLVVNGRVLR